MSLKLVIAEKPSVALSIAKVIGADKKCDGYCMGNGYIVSWCFGHLTQLKMPEEYDGKYKKWSKESLPIIPIKWEYTVISDKHKQMNLLKKLMHQGNVIEIINACDAGREGERIFRNVYNMAKCNKPIKRLWLSSMEEKAISDGFMNLKDGEEFIRLYEAAECRAKADWLVGMNFTRLMTTEYGKLLKVGRVVSPTLSFVVSRENEIKNFNQEKYYTVHISHNGFNIISENFKDKKSADELANQCKNKEITCVNVDKQVKREKAPALFDLTTLQRTANKILGFTAQETLNTAQSLYEKKLISYPRTDSRFLTDDMKDKVKRLIKLSAHSLDNVYTEGNEDRLCDSSKVTDHYAIIPNETIENYDLTILNDKEIKLLRMIETSLLISSAPDYEYMSCKAFFKCGEYDFTANYVEIIELGWKKYFDKSENELNETPAEITTGDKFTASDVSVKEGKTKPKSRYTEDTLLSAMENANKNEMSDEIERKGIGTPATRAEIIEKLIKDGFVMRDKRNLVPTELGIMLTDILPENLKSPILTAEWENMLKDVETGKNSSQAFMNDITDMVVSYIRDFQPIKIDDSINH